MPIPEQHHRWSDNPSVSFALAAMFLILGTAWLVFVQPDGWTHWLFAGGSVLAGATWLARGTSHLIRRSPRDR